MTSRENEDLDVLPRAVRQVADDCNHLHEQPVIFYAFDSIRVRFPLFAMGSLALMGIAVRSAIAALG